MLAQFMNIRLTTPFFLLLLFLVEFSTAQSNRNVVVEHFTNSRCGICASRNPGLYKNLDENPQILHVAYHPSSPYSSCVLNKHNTPENDARTRFYNLYGSTPKVAVQGVAKSSSTSFTSSDLFSGEENNTSPIEISFSKAILNASTLSANIVIKTTAENSLEGLNLFVIAVEDTVFYASPNGEDEHYDVFRKVLKDEAIVLAQNGDSVVLPVSVSTSSDWNPEHMYIMAFVQDSDSKYIEQVASSEGLHTDMVLGLNTDKRNELRIYPNPTRDIVSISGLLDKAHVRFYDTYGRIILEKEVSSQTDIDISGLSSGNYFIRVEGKELSIVKTLVIE